VVSVGVRHQDLRSRRSRGDLDRSLERAGPAIEVHDDPGAAREQQVGAAVAVEICEHGARERSGIAGDVGLLDGPVPVAVAEVRVERRGRAPDQEIGARVAIEIAIEQRLRRELLHGQNVRGPLASW